MTPNGANMTRMGTPLTVPVPGNSKDMRAALRDSGAPDLRVSILETFSETFLAAGMQVRTGIASNADGIFLSTLRFRLRKVSTGHSVRCFLEKRRSVIRAVVQARNRAQSRKNARRVTAKDVSQKCADHSWEISRRHTHVLSAAEKERFLKKNANPAAVSVS